MEPSSVGGWGRPCWTLLHCLTLDPRASRDDRMNQKRALQALRAVLPCPTCRASYQDYCKSSLHECEPDMLGDYVCQLHDKVNLKLEKPAASKTWEHWKQERLEHFRANGWSCHEELFYFFFVLAYNYPRRFARGSNVAAKHKAFYESIAHSFTHTNLGKCMASYVDNNALTDTVLSARVRLVSWVYDLYTACATMRPLQSLAKIESAMEAIRKP